MVSTQVKSTQVVHCDSSEIARSELDKDLLFFRYYTLNVPKITEQVVNLSQRHRFSQIVRNDTIVIHMYRIDFGSCQRQWFLRFGTSVKTQLGSVVIKLVLFFEKVMNLVFNLFVNFLFFNHVYFLWVLHPHDFVL